MQGETDFFFFFFSFFWVANTIYGGGLKRGVNDEEDYTTHPQHQPEKEKEILKKHPC